MTAPNRRLVVLAAALFATGCAKDSVWPERAGPKVVVSFAPIYCFATNVAGDDAVIKNMMTTTGPHDFNPTDIDAKLLRKADLFFINGIDLDNEQAKALHRGSGNRLLKVIDLGGKIPDTKLLEGKCTHDHGHAHAHDHGHDPHIWLGLDHAVLMVEGIRDELKAADPKNAANYDRRAAEYIAKLQKLRDDGRAMLKDKADRKLITFHDSLTYFANTFGLDIKGVVQKKPSVDPNSQEMSDLIKLCGENKVRVLTVEPQFSPDAAKTILTELKRKGIADAELVEIDPLETVRPDELNPDWYERKMWANIEALAKAMK